MMNIKVVISIFLSIFLFIGKGYSENRYFRHYNNKHGLSHNTVYASLQDNRGFMWFGTEDGLNRFDSHTFKVYRYNSLTGNCIPNDFIISLFEDSEDRIWICTNRGVCYYDYRTETFHPFRLNPEQEQIDYFRYVKEDAWKNLWFISYERIVRYNLTDKSYKIYPGNDNFRASSITITEEGNPLFSDGYVIYEYNRQADAFSQTAILTQSEISAQTHIDVICQVPEAGSNSIITAPKRQKLLFRIPR